LIPARRTAPGAPGCHARRAPVSVEVTGQYGIPSRLPRLSAAGTPLLETDGGDDVVDRLLELGVLLEEGLDLLDRVEDGGVVLAAEAAADVRVGMAGELAGEIHGDLAGKGHGLGAGLGAEILGPDREDLGDPPLDVLDGDAALVGSPDVGEDFLGQVKGQLATGEGAEGADPDQRTLELADVRLDLGGGEVRDVVREGKRVELGFLLEDGDTGLEVGGLDVGDKS